MFWVGLAVGGLLGYSVMAVWVMILLQRQHVRPHAWIIGTVGFLFIVAALLTWSSLEPMIRSEAMAAWCETGRPPRTWAAEGAKDKAGRPAWLTEPRAEMLCAVGQWVRAETGIHADLEPAK